MEEFSIFKVYHGVSKNEAKDSFEYNRLRGRAQFLYFGYVY
jgi:hypothetical protein